MQLKKKNISEKDNIKYTCRTEHCLCSVLLAFLHCSPCVYRSFFCALLWDQFALCVRSCSPLISTHQSPFSVCSPFAQSALTIHSPFKWEGEHFRDCTLSGFTIYAFNDCDVRLFTSCSNQVFGNFYPAY